MSFKYSVIGDNTKENREHLEKLWYEMQFVVSFVDFELIYTWKGRFYFIDKSDLEGIEMSLFINCIGNPQLFKAVSAMRDDSDIHQVFFIEGLGCKDDYWLCDTEKFNHESENLPFDVYAYSKCDLSELQAHFQSV